MKTSLLSLLSAAAIVASPTFAATVNWTAGTSLDASGTWDTNFNGQAYTGADSLVIDGTAAKTVTVSGSVTAPTSLTVSNTSATVITGSSLGGSLVKSGSAMLTLSSANAFSGVTVSGGPGAGSFNSSGAASVALNLGSYSALGAGAVTFTNTSSMNGVYFAAGAGTLNNDIQLSGSAVTTQFVAKNGTGAILNGTISGGVAGATFYVNTDTQSGSTGYIKLTGTNTFRGTIQINRGGLAVNTDAAFGNSANSITLDVGTTSAVGLRFDGAMTSARGVSLGGGVQYLDTNGNPVTLSGVISGSGNAAKIGTGALTLKGTNTFSGGTTVTTGTLVTGATAALGTSNVSVAATGTLQVGDGVVNGVTLGSAATLTTATGATLKLGSLASQITMGSGLFTVGADTKIDITGLGLGAGSYTLISSAVAGNTVGSWNSATDLIGGNGSLSYSLGLVGNNLVLTASAVPEPSTYGLMGAGALAAAALVRRRRKVK